MQDVRKQRVDFDQRSMYSDASSEDGRILGGPQLLCMLASGTLLCLVGVFITSYGFFVPAPHQHILRAVGPALLVLGVIVLLICICACLCACHKHRHLPPTFDDMSSDRHRSSFFYDDYGQDYGSNRVSFTPVLQQHPPVLHEHPPVLQHQIDISKGYANQTNDNYMNATRGMVAVDQRDPAGQFMKEMILSPVHRPLFQQSEIYQQVPYHRQLNDQDLASYHLSKQSLVQDHLVQSPTQEYAVSSVYASGSNPRFDQGHHHPSENSASREHSLVARTTSATTHTPKTQSKESCTNSSTRAPYPLDDVRSIQRPIVHSHSTHCVDTPLQMKQTIQSYLPLAQYGDHQVYEDRVLVDQASQQYGLKRVQKVVALNSGFTEDCDDKDLNVDVSGGNCGRDRTLSISAPRGHELQEHRLKRNLTVASTHKRSRSKKASEERMTSPLYRQQLSMPSGSFQHMAVMDYEKQKVQCQQMECIEKAFGSMKAKQKSVKDKRKKKTTEQDGPSIIPLPSCSTEVLKVIGVAPEDPQYPESLHSSRENILSTDERKHAVQSTRKNLREAPEAFHKDDHHNLTNSSTEGYCSSSPDYPGQEAHKFRSKENLLHDTNMIPERDTPGPGVKASGVPKIDIVQKIEEIKERIDILTKEKEKVAFQKKKSSAALFPLVNN
ncbi:hypothetical protein FHG87_017858 [Trinorchestia longiramus]|nr:hypothetical protein FHG87_017858 [Trinorchestia longiramus]